jgi:putative ABC transport system permease protein
VLEVRFVRGAAGTTSFLSIRIVLGLLFSLGLSRVLSTLFFGVSPYDPATYAGVSLGLMAVAIIACYVPARRATRVDPIVALRYE